ncbi:MAG TPA: TonB-dependent receptor plug domain-containing protein [Gemmatimonadaceae bacterium]
MPPLRAVARPLLLAALAVMLTACGTATGRRATGRSDLLTRTEIAAQHWSDAFSLVEALRPRWLSMRGPDSIQGEEVPVQVYLDGSRLGGAALLRTIPVQDIQRMEFLSGVEASSRYGVGHTNGAILVYTRT